ncbi:hypothetical protein TL16_g13064 [Triparma laevis f. inornata]|uniref:Uncharacterized protein n=1 Tax=Triparma laevis f. inornata TaxID=1714386 RepID=A0A9W7EWD7_9STRA|nr:hypothetical protein TL16_g13064 [Triparma laevis f. inornata]
MSLQSSRPGEDLVVQILKKSELKRISYLRKDRFSKEACLKELQSYRGIWEKEDRVEGGVEVKEGVMLRRCLVVEDLIEEFVKGGMTLDKKINDFAELLKEELGWDRAEAELQASLAREALEEKKKKREEEERKRKEEEEYSDQEPLGSDEEWEYWYEDEEGNKVEGEDPNAGEKESIKGFEEEEEDI